MVKGLRQSCFRVLLALACFACGSVQAVPELSGLKNGTLTALLHQSYGLPSDSSAELLCSGDNDIYLIQAPAERYILRILRPNKFWLPHYENLLFEIDLLKHLKSRGLPVSYPIAQLDGGDIAVLELADHSRAYLTLFSYAPGESRMTPRLAELYGRSVARVHQESNTFCSDYPRHNADLSFLLDDSLQRLERFLSGSNPEDLQAIARIAASVRARLSALEFQGDEWGIIHGDLHGSNHHVSVADEITHFDFDLCGYGWRAYDLAVFLWGSGSDDHQYWDRFLRGYQSVRPLSERELRAIPDFVLCRQIWLMSVYADHPRMRTELQNSWDDALQELLDLASVHAPD